VLLFIISIVLFVLMRNMGDPIATMGGRSVTKPKDRERLTCLFGLDQPLYLQYVYWLVGNDWTEARDCDGDGIAENQGRLRGVLRGDFGTSLMNRGRPALDIIGERLPNTLLLTIPSEIIVIIISLLIGIYSALKQYTIVDHIVTGVTFVGYSMPIFLIALLSMYTFGVLFKRWGLPYLPTTGMFDPTIGKTPAQYALHLVLPLFSLTVIAVAGYSRYVRSTMLEVLGQDYIRTARSKGLPRQEILFIHALKNASLPLITIVGLDLPFLLAGALVTEGIFAWAGMGHLFIEHVSRGDTPVVMGILMMIALAVIVFQIITDITYAWLDPRIRFD